MFRTAFWSLETFKECTLKQHVYRIISIISTACQLRGAFRTWWNNFIRTTTTGWSWFRILIAQIVSAISIQRSKREAPRCRSPMPGKRDASIDRNRPRNRNCPPSSKAPEFRLKSDYPEKHPRNAVLFPNSQTAAKSPRQKASVPCTSAQCVTRSFTASPFKDLSRSVFGSSKVTACALFAKHRMRNSNRREIAHHHRSPHRTAASAGAPRALYSRRIQQPPRIRCGFMNDSGARSRVIYYEIDGASTGQSVPFPTCSGFKPAELERTASSDRPALGLALTARSIRSDQARRSAKARHLIPARIRM